MFFSSLLCLADVVLPCVLFHHHVFRHTSRLLLILDKRNERRRSFMIMTEVSDNKLSKHLIRYLLRRQILDGQYISILINGNLEIYINYNVPFFAVFQFREVGIIGGSKNIPRNSLIHTHSNIFVSKKICTAVNIYCYDCNNSDSTTLIRISFNCY